MLKFGLKIETAVKNVEIRPYNEGVKENHTECKNQLTVEGKVEIVCISFLMTIQLDGSGKSIDAG